MPRGYTGRFITPSEASRKWRDRNPEQVRKANRTPRVRTYDPVKTKEWRQARLSKPEYRLRINKQANERAANIRRWLDAFKLSLGCIDCGYKKHPAALHFDHISGEKEINVCNAKSVRQAQTEIAKCVVRCANCHAEKTFTLHPCKPDIFEQTYEAVS